MSLDGFSIAYSVFANIIVLYPHKASFVFCFMKAIFPPINYGGEPSVTIGIVSQPPSSHLSIHRVPAKLENEVMPHGTNLCRLRLLFLLDFY